MHCITKNFHDIEKTLCTRVDNLVLQMPLKFQDDRIEIFRVSLLAELKNAVLRKTSLKFAFLPTCSLRCSTRKAVTLKIKYFISLRVRKCGLTHASRAEIRIFTPRDIKFRTILVRKNVFLTSVITSLAFGSCCKLTLVRKRFIALVA